MPSKRSMAVSDDEIREALVASHGLVSVAARSLGMLTRDLRARLNENSELREVLYDTDAMIAGLAELQWIKNLEKGIGVIPFLKRAGFPFHESPMKPGLPGRMTEQEYERFRLTGKLPPAEPTRRGS